MIKSLLALFTLLHSISLNAQNKKIIGVWWNDTKTSRISVYEENGKIYGKVIWLKEDVNKDGTSPRRDIHNDKKSLQKRRILGLVILKDLEWDEDENEWTNGTIYSPNHGKNFSCYAKLQKNGSLYIKGYLLGMSFFGASTTWTRYK